MTRSKALAVTVASSAVIAFAPSGAEAATKACAPVPNPYPDTRYAGVPLSNITANGVTCTTARRAARGAHRKALRLSTDESGVRRFVWDSWSVVGDVTGSHDRYTATKRGHTVRWRF